MLITPGRAPPTLTQTRRTARPIVALARKPAPKTDAAQLISSVWRRGPFTITSGVTASVVPDTPTSAKSGSQIASTAASTTGRYAGRQPAITAFTATRSTVARPLAGATRPISSSPRRPLAATAARTRSAVGGTTGRPSVTPRANRSSSGSIASALTARILTPALDDERPLRDADAHAERDATHRRRSDGARRGGAAPRRQWADRRPRHGASGVRVRARARPARRGRTRRPRRSHIRGNGGAGARARHQAADAGRRGSARSRRRWRR